MESFAYVALDRALPLVASVQHPWYTQDGAIFVLMAGAVWVGEVVVPVWTDVDVVPLEEKEPVL